MQLFEHLNGTLRVNLLVHLCILHIACCVLRVEHGGLLIPCGSVTAIVLNGEDVALEDVAGSYVLAHLASHFGILGSLGEVVGSHVGTSQSCQSLRVLLVGLQEQLHGVLGCFYIAVGGGYGLGDGVNLLLKSGCLSH